MNDLYDRLRPGDEPLDAATADRIWARIAGQPGADDRRDAESHDGVSADFEWNGSPADRPRSRRFAALLATAAAVVGLAATAVVVSHRQNVVAPSDSPDPITSPVTTPLRTIPSTGVDATQGLGVDPAMLPDGLVVWDVASSVSSMREPMTTQLFAEPVADGEPIARGVIVTVSPLNDTGADPDIPTTLVRGQRGLLLGDNLLAWDEDGISLMARSKDLSVDETVAVLDELELRANPLDGFEPGPASTFALVTETTGGPDHVDTLTFFKLGQPDRVPSTYEIAAENEPPSVIIGTGFALAASPEILLYGQPQSDGTIESPLLAYGLDDPHYARYRLNDDSSVTMVSGDTLDERTAVMNATRLMSSGELESIVSDVSARLGELPEVTTQDFGAISVVARGGSIDEPSALCVDVESTTACRLTFKVPVTSGQITVGDQTYFIGVQHDGPPIVLAEWQPGLPLALSVDAAFPTETSTASDGTTYSATLIPSDIDATITGIITDDQITFPVGNQSGLSRLTALG